MSKSLAERLMDRFKKWRWPFGLSFKDGSGNLYVVAEPEKFYRWQGDYDVFKMSCLQPVYWSFPSWRRADVSIPFKNQDELINAGYTKVEI